MGPLFSFVECSLPGELRAPVDQIIAASICLFHSAILRLSSALLRVLGIWSAAGNADARHGADMKMAETMPPRPSHRIIVS